MSERIVNILKLVHIYNKYGKLLAGTASSGNCRIKAGIKECTVRQACQRIVAGKMRQLSLGLLSRYYIFQMTGNGYE